MSRQPWKKVKVFPSNAIIQLKDVEGNAVGGQVQVPMDISAAMLQELLQSVGGEEDVPYVFYVNEKEIREDLIGCLKEQDEDVNTELVIPVVFQAQAIFRVKSVTRCTSSLPGHTDSILSVSFSPDGQFLASGSGDSTVRVWNVNTELPQCTLRGHKDWILAVAWSPDGQRLATASKDSQIRIWDPSTGKQIPKKPLRGHSKAVMGLSWQPEHLNARCDRLASASKDGTIKIWNTVRGDVVTSLSSHTACVTCVVWGGRGLLYSSSRDRSIKVWNPDTGVLVRSLEGHGHWVNWISVNTDAVLRTGAFDRKGKRGDAKARYEEAGRGQSEQLISASDDLTMMLWSPETDKKPVERLTGHQQPVSVARFSPDGNTIASASFDGSVRLWHAKTGKFIARLRGHVGPVFQLAWSADSRLVVSGSRDSTLKVWELASRKQLCELPGHSDEVFAVDWSPDGARVASGGRDMMLKFWRR